MRTLKQYINLANLLDESGLHEAAKIVDEYIKTSDLQLEMVKEVSEKDEDNKDEDAEEIDVSKKKKITLKFD